MRTKIKKSLSSRLLSIGFLILAMGLLVPTLTQPVYATGQNDMSLYMRTREVARAFETARAPGARVDRLGIIYNDKTGEKNKISSRVEGLIPGNAGGLLGFSDLDGSDIGISGWGSDKPTPGQSVISYDGLKNILPIYSGGGDNPFMQYANFGKSLSEMGITEIVTNDSSIANTAATTLTLFIYTISKGAPFLFTIALQVLSEFNPFRLFGTLLGAADNIDLGMIDVVVGYISDIYMTIQSFSIGVLFPMMLIFTVLGVLVTAKGQALKKFGRYFLMVFMLFAGLPIIGATYTGVIEGLKDDMKIGSTYADYLMLSSYLDFEAWVNHSRLALPEDVVIIDRPKMGDSADEGIQSVATRDMVLTINAMGGNNSYARDLYETYGVSDEMKGSTNKAISTGAEGRVLIDDIEELTKEDVGDSHSIIDILNRHAESAKMTGSNFDSTAKGLFQRLQHGASGGQPNDATIDNTLYDMELIRMVTLTDNADHVWNQSTTDEYQENITEGKIEPIIAIDWANAHGLFYPGPATHPHPTTPKRTDFQFKFPGYPDGIPINMYNNGSLTTVAGKYNAGDHGKFEWQLSQQFMTVDQARFDNSDKLPAYPMMSVQEGIDPGGYVTGLLPGQRDGMGGLSTLAMYNFLNTTFTDTGIIIYSSDKTYSHLSRDHYASVVFAGTGLVSSSRYIENMIIMLSMTLLALTFGWMMIGAAFKNIPRILTGIFGTALGSIALLTKLLISTGVMIIHVLSLMFFYLLAEDIVMAVITGSDKLTGATVGYFSGSGTLSIMMTTLMTCIIIIAVTYFMIKNVGTFKNVLEEATSNGIAKVMSTLDVATGGEGISTAQATGGRVGDDGSMSQQALEDDAKTGLIGGAASLAMDAHDMESRMEDAQGGVNYGETAIGNRRKTTAALAKAKMSDKAKRAVGLQGNAEQRLRDDITGQAQAARHGGGRRNEESLGKMYADGIIDEKGNLINPDPNANPFDKVNPTDHKEGGAGKNAFKAAAVAGAGFLGVDLLTDDEDKAIYAMDGEDHIDEYGNVMHEDEDGNLVDKDGNFMSIGADGVMTASDIGVNAAEQVSELDRMRSDEEAFEQMQEAQMDGTSYGIDGDGNAISDDGQPLMFKNAAGEMEAASLSDGGYLQDSEGNAISADSIEGGVAQGYDAIEGNNGTFLKHKGDEAIKMGGDDTPIEEQSLSGLEKQADMANNQEDMAVSKLNDLESSNASGYAVSQAKAEVKAAKTNASQKNEALSSETKRRKNDPSATPNRSNRSVSKASVDKANGRAVAKQNSLASASANLSNLQGSGASPQEIATAQGIVNRKKNEAQNATSTAQAAAVAHTANRPLGEVLRANNKVSSAEADYTKKQQVHSDNVSKGVPAQVLEKSKNALNKSSENLSNSYLEQSRVSQPRSGTSNQVEVSRQDVSNANRAVNSQEARVNKLRHQPGISHTEIQKEERVLNSLKNDQRNATSAYSKVDNPKNWGNQQKVTFMPEIKKDIATSRLTLKEHGINNYGDFKSSVVDASEAYKTSRKNTKAFERISKDATARNATTPRIEKNLVDAKRVEARAKEDFFNLTSNVGGLLDSGVFQPIGTTRPVRIDGGEIVNRMQNMNNTQAIYDKIASIPETMRTDSDNQRAEMLKGIIDKERIALSSDGIDKNMIQTRQQVSQMVRTFGKAWNDLKTGQYK